MATTWGVRCVRSGCSVFGGASAWAKNDGEPWRGTKEEAEAKAKEWNRYGGKVFYYAKRRKALHHADCGK